MRLRQFSQDDGHIFCSPEQVAEELRAFCRRIPAFYRDFGLQQLEVFLSGRPAQSEGAPEGWAWAEQQLAEAASAAGLSPRPQPGQGAFYGPKLEFGLRDSVGRLWQCGTIQLDAVLPGRFGVFYVNAAGERVPPLMLHRALFGSVERFLAILLEHHRGVLPAWLAPEQVVLVEASGGQEDYARGVQSRLEAVGLRVARDVREVSLGRKVADAHQLGVPFVAVVGPREAKAQGLSVRERGGVSRSLGLEAAVGHLLESCRRG